jgi:hypothetical protein
MAGGVFEGLGKLLSAGNAYLQQHQHFIDRLRGLQLDDARAQLTAYVRGMPDARFNGLKLALTFVARTSQDVATSRLLQGLLRSLDAVRAGRAAEEPPEPPALGPPPLVDVARAPSFDDDLTMVAGWHDHLDQEGRAAALFAHLEGLSPQGFRVFREHLGRMLENATTAVRRHEESEDNAWGGSVEDRMSYMMARIKTGQRDPQFVARLREMRGYLSFYEWVAGAADVAWQELQQKRVSTGATTMPQEPAPSNVPSDKGGMWLVMVGMLRTQLEQGLADGRIRRERRASYERLLDKMEALTAPISDPDTPLDEKQKLLERFKGLMAEFQQYFVDAGAADRLEGVPEGARARTLDGFVSAMKGVLYRELAQSPPRHTADRAGELMSDVTRAHQEIAQLHDDRAAVTFEREMLRGAARGLHEFMLREHLMLVRPLWQCAEVVPSPRGLFVAGGADLAELARSVAARLDLEIPAARGQYYGQARWDALRGSHVGVFDLRGYRPGLVRTDPAAAAALAGTAYELGLACALGRPMVVVTREGDSLPFDVDIAPCEISGDATADEQALISALDDAWYGQQRTSGASCLTETFAFLERATRDHPRRRMLEVSGVLVGEQAEDPVGFAGCVRQIVREQGLRDLEVVFPAWPGRYPDEASPTLFHVMPFAEPWSDDVRDAAREACDGRGHVYRRGDESDEGRIIHAIWDDICAANLVLVDLTGLNLNVLIELGMAHALGRTVLTVRQSGVREPLPRNIEKLRVLDYDGPSALSRLLEKRLAPRPAGV